LLPQMDGLATPESSLRKNLTRRENTFRQVKGFSVPLDCYPSWMSRICSGYSPKLSDPERETIGVSSSVAESRLSPNPVTESLSTISA
jgi:hypothetical protein